MCEPISHGDNILHKSLPHFDECAWQPLQNILKLTDRNICITTSETELIRGT
jgi:hypothetical protein